MNVPRFLVDEKIKLTNSLWIDDVTLLARLKVKAGLSSGGKVVLLDGLGEARLYKIAETEPSAVRLQLISELEPKFPEREVYVAFVPDENTNSQLAAAVKTGARHFLPIKTDAAESVFDIDGTLSVVIAAFEDTDWSMLPSVRMPVRLEILLEEFKNKIPAFAFSENQDGLPLDPDTHKITLLLTPKNGWSADDRKTMNSYGVNFLSKDHAAELLSAEIPGNRP